MASEEVEVVLQVNGKVRGHIRVPAGITPKELEEKAAKDPQLQSFLQGKTVRKVIVVPGRLVNIAAG